MYADVKIFDDHYSPQEVHSIADMRHDASGAVCFCFSVRSLSLKLLCRACVLVTLLRPGFQHTVFRYSMIANRIMMSKWYSAFYGFIVVMTLFLVIWVSVEITCCVQYCDTTGQLIMSIHITGCYSP